MKVVCITNDVEATTIQGEAYNQVVASRVRNEAMPITLDLYRKYGIKATFFCLGTLIEQYPDIAQRIQQEGHEVACHGWVHDSSLAFDVMSEEQQIEHLCLAKQTLEKAIDAEVVSFRAPALRVNEFTAKALIALGFTHDSSVAPQRLDAFISLGSKKKLQWIGAPRCVYNTHINNLARVGKTNITEVPVSAFGLPYIGAMLRLSPILTKLMRWCLYLETRRNNKKVVTLLFHPNELIERHESLNIIRRSKNPIVHLLTGKLRVILKRRNFGEPCVNLIENEIRFWQEHGYEFKTIKEL
ncbi:MAG: polysaccharide deacetylase family protein [Paludibacteraceae bacterium]|nr:polysaccharide deacetylase family protein [Paludibacteraceae bacterium]